jgi:hypothetical protein
VKDGMDDIDITELFQGDKQLVDIWKYFLTHNDWIEDSDGKSIVTDTGKEMIRKHNGI